MNACEKTFVYVCRRNRNLQKVQTSAGFGFSGWLKATPVAVSDGRRPGPLARTRTLSQGSNFMAGAAFWQGRVQISWQVHHFHKVKCRFRDRRGIFLLLALARTRKAAHADFVAGAAFSRGQEQISWQGHHFRKVKYIIRGRCSTFARSSAKFVAGASLSQGLVAGAALSRGFRGRRSSFCKVNFRSRGSKIATFKCESSKRSQLSQLGLQNHNF